MRLLLVNSGETVSSLLYHVGSFTLTGVIGNTLWGSPNAPDSILNLMS